MQRGNRLAYLLLCAGVFFARPVSALHGADFHVSPDGDDANPGTMDNPFRSVARAQRAVRERIAKKPSANVEVQIRKGVYQLASPLSLGPTDSGSEQLRVTYAAASGEKVVLSGGRRIKEWKPHEDGIWVAHLPEIAAGEWRFRQLFVNGRRAVRARTPNASDRTRYWRLLDGRIAKDLTSHTVSLDPALSAKLPSSQDMEIVVLKNWATLHKRVQNIDRAKGRVVLHPPHVKYFSSNRPRRGCACFFVNALEFLDEPGEWFGDRKTGMLYYLPRPDEDMRTARVVVPRLTRLLSLTGKPDRPVRNVHFRGLTFLHAALPLPQEGHHGRQACFRYGLDNFAGRMPSAITWRHVADSSMVGCRIAHVGGGGIDLEDGCHSNLIEGNHVWDTAGNGIGLGGANDAKLVPTNNRIANNYVHHCGAVYLGACGIWVGFAQKTLVSHNLVCHLPYTGISFGWQWNPQPTAAREYTIEHNHVHDVMREVSDGGALYSLGYQPGTIVRHNHLHDVHRSEHAHAAPNNGIFFDQGSKGFFAQGTVIYRTSGTPIRFNQCKKQDHTWEDNHFGISPNEAASTDAYKLAGLEAEWAKRLLLEVGEP